jgi:pimeloyl-ACP methyl ester carboxylesterase
MFLPAVKNVVEAHKNSSVLKVLKSCGHVVNVEQPAKFNESAIGFIRQLT